MNKHIMCGDTVEFNEHSRFVGRRAVVETIFRNGYGEWVVEVVLCIAPQQRIITRLGNLKKTQEESENN